MLILFVIDMKPISNLRRSPFNEGFCELKSPKNSCLKKIFIDPDPKVIMSISRKERIMD